MDNTIINSFIPKDKPYFAFVVDTPSFDDWRNNNMQQLKGQKGWPLYGTIGQRFTAVTKDAGIDRWESYVGYAIPEYLPSKKVESVCVDKETQFTMIDHIQKGGKPDFPIPTWAFDAILKVARHPIKAGGYVPSAYWPHLIKLWFELRSLEWEHEGLKLPIVVPMGNIALWATCGKLGIDKARGAITDSIIPRTDNTPFIAFPTFHPQFTMYNEKQRPLLVADMKKLTSVVDLKAQLHKVNIWIPQTTEDLIELCNKYITNVVGVDIETPRKQRSKLIDLYEEDTKIIDLDKWPPIATRADRFIKMIGFNSDGANSIVVPFFHPSMTNGCWWKTKQEHFVALKYVAALLEDYNISKIFQNGSFDVQYIQEIWGIAVNSYKHDTRLMHHALQPAMPKDLATLASVYLNFPAWKYAPQTGKRDE